MRRIHAAQLPAHAGEPVMIAGWVHRRRLLKQVTFLIIRDATGYAQAVVTDPAVRAYVAQRLTEETVVRVSGRLVSQPAAPGGVELADPVIEVLGDVAAPPPFDLYRPALAAALPTQLDHAPRDPHRLTP